MHPYMTFDDPGGVVLFVLLRCLLTSAQIPQEDISDNNLVTPGDSYSLPGTYYFGGLFNVHNSRGGICYQTNPRGLQRMYAMVYAINMINERQDILPNITIGKYLIYTMYYFILN